MATIMDDTKRVPPKNSGIKNIQVNNHPHSGWLDFALKGRKAKARSAWVVFCSDPPPIEDPAICGDADPPICGEARVFMKTINNRSV